MKKHLYYLLLFTSNLLISQNGNCDITDSDSWIFTDAKGNNLTIYTNKQDNTKAYYDSEFFVSDKKNICDFYRATNQYKIESLKDTLNIYEIYNLCLGENFECKSTKITKKSYFFKDSIYQSKTVNVIPSITKIPQHTIDNIHNTIDNMSVFRTSDVNENLKNINIFIKKLEKLAIYGDLKSFIKLVELNKYNNPELSYSARKAVSIVMDLIYLNTKKDATQQQISNYLIYGRGK